MTGAEAEAELAELVRLIQSSGSAPDLLRKHAADSSGRCPRCSSGGDSSGRQLAPCTLYRAALAASAGGAG